jgi:hypothetical protein
VMKTKRKQGLSACQRRGPVYNKWWLLPELNWGHRDFQSPALPTELKSHPKSRV